MTTWADIKALAADLQRVQLSEGAKKLSENNCIEVVQKLMAGNLLELIFTTDGREYVTKKHLTTEIRNECLAYNGRAPIGDIAAALRVEFGQIESLIDDVVSNDDDFFVCNGELISSEYIRKTCNDVDAKLQESGSISLQHLTKTLRVPTEVLNGHILPSIGSTIDAVQYGDMLYTTLYLRSQRNALRAVLTSLTRVTPLSRIQQHLNVSPSLFSSLWDELREIKALPGNIVGNKNSSNALYVPRIHERMAKQYTLNAFSDTQVIDFATLKKLFIFEPKAYLKQIFSKDEMKNIVVFPNCAVSHELWQEIENSVSHEMSKSSYCDIPSIFQSIQHPLNVPSLHEAVEFAGQTLLKQHPDWRVTESGELCYDICIIGKAAKEIDSCITAKAEAMAPEYAKQMRQQQGQKSKSDTKKNNNEEDDWDTNAGGKKKKGGKQKGGKQSRVSEEPKQQSVNISIADSEILEELKSNSTLPEELIDEIFDDIKRHIDQVFREKVETALLSIHQSAAQSQKKAFLLLQQQVLNLYSNICLFEQGTSEFDDAISQSLKQHLLRTMCTDLANAMLEYVSGTSNVGSLTSKVRSEVIDGIPSAESREAITELYANLSDLDKFLESSLTACSIRLRSPDKQALDQLREAHLKDLRSQLSTSTDPASAFLLAVLVFLATRLNLYIHASGKFVRELLNHIERAGSVKKAEVELLNDCHKLVVASLKKSGDGDGANLSAKIDELKSMVA